MCFLCFIFKVLNNRFSGWNFSKWSNKSCKKTNFLPWSNFKIRTGDLEFVLSLIIFIDWIPEGLQGIVLQWPLEKKKAYFRGVKVAVSKFYQELIVINFCFLNKLIQGLAWFAGLESDINCYFMALFKNALIWFDDIKLRGCCFYFESHISIRYVVNSEVGLHLLVRLHYEAKFLGGIQSHQINPIITFK